LYLSLGDPNPDGALAVRLYYKPLVLLIWLGAVVMVIGGALSLSDRRLRVGGPRPARSKDNAKAALQPAEEGDAQASRADRRAAHADGRGARPPRAAPRGPPPCPAPAAG